MLRHGKAADEVLKMASDMRCSVCDEGAKIKATRPAQASELPYPLTSVQFDGKELPGWRRGQKIKCLNVICEGSHWQVMEPLLRGESSKEIRKTYVQSWKRPYGAPDQLRVDAARWNTGPEVMTGAERDGTHVFQAPGEAHHHVGLAERHGGLVENMLVRVVKEMQPQNYDQWYECLQMVMDVKNSSVQVGGYSPEMLLFGRSRPIPEDLCSTEAQRNPQVNSMIVNGDILERVSRCRRHAREAFARCMDDKSLRAAQEARPRVYRSFGMRDLVCFWRKQKAGESPSKGRWHGPAVVGGLDGQCYMLIYGGQLIKASAEQMRMASSEETLGYKEVATELKEMTERLKATRGGVRGFTDISKDGPAPGVIPAVGNEESPGEPTVNPDVRVIPVPAPRVPQEPVPELPPVPEQDGEEQPEAPGQEELEDLLLSPRDKRPLDGGPRSPPKYRRYPEDCRKEHRGYKPAEDGDKKPEEVDIPDEADGDLEMDFVAYDNDTCAAQEEPEAERCPFLTWKPPKQELPAELWENFLQTPPGGRHYFATCAQENPMWRLAAEMADDVGWAEDVLWAALHCPRSCSKAEDLPEPEGDPVAAVDAHVVMKRKKQGKDISEKSLTPERKLLFEGAKKKEWDMLKDEHKALRLLDPDEAAKVELECPDRVMQARYLLDDKWEDDVYRAKARMILPGHLDPDVEEMERNGENNSSTVMSFTRNVCLQLLATLRFKMSIGDVKGAFLVADRAERASGPLYGRVPKGGVGDPSVAPGSLFEVLGHIYGLNNSPPAWQATATKRLLECDYVQSRYDPCMSIMMERKGDGTERVCSLVVTHVGDFLFGGRGAKHEQAVKRLKQTFKFRSWRDGDGEFTGVHLKQDPYDYSIVMSQRKFALGVRPLKLRKAPPQTPASGMEITAARGLLGSVNWIAHQTRPDLSAMVSFGQQLLSKPTVGNLTTLNNMQRRCRQFCDMSIRFVPIDAADLVPVVHTDASLANGQNLRTQGGYVVGVAQRSKLRSGEKSMYAPVGWRSSKLRRIVGSTLASETQSMRDGLGHLVWMSRIISEILDGPELHAQHAQELVRARGGVSILDAKSVYDPLGSPSSPGTLHDKFVSIDVAIIREACNDSGIAVRWTPSALQLGDCLTKSTADSCDTLRSVLRTSMYQISSEKQALADRAEERERRRMLGMKNQEKTHERQGGEKSGDEPAGK